MDDLETIIAQYKEIARFCRGITTGIDPSENNKQIIDRYVGSAETVETVVGLLEELQAYRYKYPNAF